MKPIRYIAYTALCSLLLAATGCHREEMTMPSDSSTFTIQIAGEGSSSVLTRTEVVENVTTPLHLLIYKVGAGDGDTPVYYKKDTLTDATIKKIKCNLPTDMSKTDMYDIYVVGSPDGDATGISATMTKSALLAFTQTGIDAITSKTKHYMLAGVTLNTTLDPSPTVQIVRNVCRLDFTLTDESGNVFTDIEATLSAPDITFLFSSALRGAGLDNTFPVGMQNSEQVFKLTPDAATSGKFAGSVFFFEKMTTAAGVKTEADRVKIAITATSKGVKFRFATYINADANYITKRNTIYEVNGKVKDGTIIINTIKLPWGEVVQGEEKPDRVIIQPKANTYLVAPNSRSILIPVAQANDAIAGSIAVGDVLTTELVWTDVKGATTGKGLAQDAAVAAIEVIGTGPDAVLMVTPGSQLGNAVIAVKGGSDIKWSWHIWVSDYDPEQNVQQETGQNRSTPYIFMDRNLGAKSTVPHLTGVDIAGTFYQFGRKDPFPTKDVGLTWIPVYNAEGTVVTREVGATSAQLQISKPYMWGSSGLPTGLDLWGEGGAKTVNDPCPAGWRVPSNSAFIDLTDALLPKDDMKAGRQGRAGYFPYTWMVHPTQSTVWNVNLVANWTSTPSGGTNGIMLRCDHMTSVNGNYPWVRTYGNTVRCVRDLRTEKLEKEVRILSVGAYLPSGAHQSGGVLGTKTYSVGLVPLLDANFGPGKPVDVFFKHYTHYNGGLNQVGLDYNIIDILTKNEIDVLFLPWNYTSGSPSVEQSKAIVQWLEADPHRFLLMTPDYMPSLKNLQAELGFTKSSTTQENQPAQWTSLVDNEMYNTLIKGKYGEVTNRLFTMPIDWGCLNRDEVEANGYVPIIEYTTNPRKVVMAVHPTKRVAIMTETGFFDLGTAMNADGSLTKTTKGDYPILMANMWAWIVEIVKAK